MDSERGDPPVESRPSLTKAELATSKEESRRHYLALYRRQRKELDREIARLERAGGRRSARRPARRWAKRDAAGAR